jgi:hypothetical protein
MDQLTARENISIADLRQPMNIEAFPQMIPGALRIAMEEIEERHAEIPRGFARSFSTVREKTKRPKPVCIVNVAGELQGRSGPSDRANVLCNSPTIDSFAGSAINHR